MMRTDWLSRWANYSPHKTALSTWPERDTITYAELNTWAEQVGTWLIQAYGLEKGDRIAILADFDLAYGALFGAVQKYGFILVPINYRLSPKEVDYILQNATPKLLLCSTNYQNLCADIRQTSCHIAPFDKIQALRESNTEVLPNQHITEDDSAFILYTSGTTGFPKGAHYTHKMLLWNSLNTLMRLNLTADDTTVLCMPPFHTGGWNVLLTPLLHLGGSVVLMKKFDADGVLQALDEHRATLFMGVPTMLRMMADCETFATAQLEALRYFIVGGEAMPVPLIEVWDQKGVPVRQGYGMTEVGPNLFSLHQDDAVRKKGSIGKPNFYVEARLITDKGALAAANERGELQLRGPMATPGYWQNPSSTDKAFTEDGWFKTGDVLIEDEEGYFFVVDRIKNMYISGGENVYPAEVERVIQQIPAVAEVLVLGVPHPKWGESGRAFVALLPGTELSSADIRAFCQEHLAKFKVPSEVVFLPQLPQNATGKIDRNQLMKL